MEIAELGLDSVDDSRWPMCIFRPHGAAYGLPGHEKLAWVRHRSRSDYDVGTMGPAARA
jgi:hypothetical protein